MTFGVFGKLFFFTGDIPSYRFNGQLFQYIYGIILNSWCLVCAVHHSICHDFSCHPRLQRIVNNTPTSIAILSLLPNFILSDSFDDWIPERSIFQFCIVSRFEYPFRNRRIIIGKTALEVPIFLSMDTVYGLSIGSRVKSINHWLTNHSTISAFNQELRYFKPLFIEHYNKFGHYCVESLTL